MRAHPGPKPAGIRDAQGQLPQLVGVLNGKCSPPEPASTSSILQDGSSWCRRTNQDHLLRATLTWTSDSLLGSQKSSSCVLSPQEKGLVYQQALSGSKSQHGSTFSVSVILTFPSFGTDWGVGQFRYYFFSWLALFRSTELTLYFLSRSENYFRNTYVTSK